MPNSVQLVVVVVRLSDRLRVVLVSLSLSLYQHEHTKGAGILMPLASRGGMSQKRR